MPTAAVRGCTGNGSNRNLDTERASEPAWSWRNRPADKKDSTRAEATRRIRMVVCKMYEDRRGGHKRSEGPLLHALGNHR